MIYLVGQECNLLYVVVEITDILLPFINTGVWIVVVAKKKAILQKWEVSMNSEQSIQFL